MLNKKALAGTPSTPPVYVEDVFSTYLYSGNTTSQTITNNIDISGKGGLVWVKSRNSGYGHVLVDTARGSNKLLFTHATDAEATDSTAITAFNNNGFSVGSYLGTNANAATYASWTFREQAKFFDVVTFTSAADGSATVNHNLGSVPGMVISKTTDRASDWYVTHRSLSSGTYLRLNTTGTTANYAGFQVATSTQITYSTGSWVGNAQIVLYIYAHDAGGFGTAGTDNVISCGSFTNDGGGAATISLGYEPQYVLIKNTEAAENWTLADVMRGMPNGSADAILEPNTSSAESSYNFITPTATGFNIQGLNASQTYIYMAIRRPMKTPTSGTEVFSPTLYTGTNADNRLIDTGILTDMVMIKERNDTVAGMVTGDRLRGQPYLLTGSTAAEVDDADSFDRQIVSTTEYGTAFSSHTGVYVGNDATAKVNIDTTSNNHIALAFKRATGFFDVVCYTGTGSATTVTHNLGVAPELYILKCRNSTELTNWVVAGTVLSSSTANYLYLNTTGSINTSSNIWQAPTSTTIGIGSAFPNDKNLNQSGLNYVAYLFATVAGVSKVGSYTGNGSNQTINCGFTAGARFVMIKRTDSTGDWYVYDTARGIVSGNDPQLKLNTADAEATGYDAIDPDNSGFIVNNDATNFPINVNNATYIYLAIA